ncbi:MAG: hypothetical protein LBS59_05895 [Puniceicoccales bacterium]|jgi:hypothetical protein|nr:hypothetical protein [Puniceicoccales bacterium]
MHHFRFSILLLTGIFAVGNFSAIAKTPPIKPPSAPKAPSISPKCIAFVEEVAKRKLTPNEYATKQALWDTLERTDELLADWLRQDLNDFSGRSLFADDDPLAKLQLAIAKAAGNGAPANPAKAGTLTDYRALCLTRRAKRIKTATANTPRIVYARHFVMGGSHYAYTEALSDAQNERYFVPGGKLCLAEATPDGIWKETVLLETKEGVIRDVDVSFDAKRILFSWKKSLNGDDYHLYEIPVDANGKPNPARIRQLTSGKGVADYEGCYLPDGNILFNSSRCQQIVDCWWTEVSNLYRCDANGRNILRLTFDQVHDNYPAITWDGRILYTRWEYNDRSQMYPQPLFQMALDGTSQRAVYGENSWFPTTIAHARSIPGSQDMFAIATGHHTRQPGELILIEPAKGRQETEGITRLAPIRPHPNKRPVIIDVYGQNDALFAYPYPLDSRQLLVTHNPEGWHGNSLRKKPGRDFASGFAIYWTDIEGNRELLTSRLDIACGRAVPLAPRPTPPVRPSLVDYTKDEGSFYILDVHAGEAMRDVPRGSVKTLRVVELDFRVAGIHSNGNGGPGGSALVCTPIAIGNGAWDVKIPLGDVKVHDDGSVFFTAPARRPLYFMLLDKDGRTIQTMRSWTTLQPGENASCIGCHEHKNEAPPPSARLPKALLAGPQKLKPFWKEFSTRKTTTGKAFATTKNHLERRGISFPLDIQPILDKHCVSCHKGPPQNIAAASGKPPKQGALAKNQEQKPKKTYLDLRGIPINDPQAGRAWSHAYLTLTNSHGDRNRGGWGGRSNHPRLNWISAASVPTLIKPYAHGSNSSALFKLLDKGHGKTISQKEKALLAAWVDLGVPYCGDYQEANIWNDANKAKHAKYQAKRDLADAADAKTLRALKFAAPR